MAHPPSPPKPKPKDAPQDLAEVERALSILHGRHPEHERMRREDEEKKAQRTAVLDASSKQESRRVLFRRAKVAGVALVVLAAGVVIAGSVRHDWRRRARLSSVADPYVAMGFSVVETSSRGEPDRLAASVESGCVLAISAAEGTSPNLRLKHPGGVLEGPGPVLTCLCEGGPVEVSTAGREGIVLLRADATVHGGSKAFAFLPFSPATKGHTDQACADASLDAWALKNAPSTATDEAASDRWLEKQPKLRAFRVAAIIRKDIPLGRVEFPSETCVLIVGKAMTSLRAKGGALAIGPASGNIGWCTATAQDFLVQREGNDEVAVLIAPAAKIGGLQGLREIADGAGLALAASGVPTADRSWNAKQVLVASSIPDSLITVGIEDSDKEKDARVAALSVDKPNALVSESPDGVFSFCDPPLAEATSSVCVFSGTQRWRIEGADTVAGLARARMPFWLFGFQGVNEPAALQRETQLVTLARKLRREGFEPTTIDGVTETDKGVEVLGRAKEDAFVAVGVAATEPWVFPYSTDGAPWSIDGKPLVVPIKPLERIHVQPAAKTKLPPKATRRTIVFRRVIPA